MYEHNTMKKILIGTMAVIVLFGMTSLSVLASTVNQANGNSLLPHSMSTKLAPMPIFHAPVYEVSYTDPFFGPVKCQGVHLTTLGTTTPVRASLLAGGNDTFVCTSTTGDQLTGVTPGENLSLATFGNWISDYFGQFHATVYATSFTGVVWSDGFSYTATAVY